jgi:hypothetical protein
MADERLLSADKLRSIRYQVTADLTDSRFNRLYRARATEAAQLLTHIDAQAEEIARLRADTQAADTRVYGEAVAATLREIEDYANRIALPVDSEDDAERTQRARLARAIRCAVEDVRKRRYLAVQGRNRELAELRASRGG